jgi:hypothetical protein
MGKVRIGKWEVDEKELDRESAEARRRGKEAMAREPQAKSVHYDRSSHRLIVELKNGTTFIVPCELLQGLRGAAPNDIAKVTLGPRGAALRWDRLDVDFSLVGLLAGTFGNTAWMAELAGNQATSVDKSTTTRRYGKAIARSPRVRKNATSRAS